MAEYKDVAELKKQIADFKKAMYSPNSDYMTGYICALSVTEGVIASLPAADVVEVRHGKWLFDDGMDRYCSECGHMALTSCFEYKQICTPYCPNCGAKMDGGEDNV